MVRNRSKTTCNLPGTLVGHSKIIISLTANDLSGGPHPGEIAGKKRKGMDTGIISKLIKTCPPDGDSTEGITQSFSGVTWIHTGPYI
mgnify:CR=1 FL=1